MPSDTPARCEPPEALRGVSGMFYIQYGDELPGACWWNGADGRWSWPGGTGSAQDLAAIGYRYLSPVPTPSEIAALVRAGRAVASEFAQHHPLIAALSTALAAPSFKEIGDE